MIKLETDRLILRNYTMEDIDDIFEYFSDEEVSKYEDFNPMTRSEAEQLIMEWQDKDYRLVVEQKAENKVIGSIGYLKNIKGVCSIDYDFNPKYSKCGYATEAAKRLIEHIFEIENIQMLYAECDILNINSRKLLERLGFLQISQKEGDSYKNDKSGNPIFITSCTYMLLRS